MLGYETKNASSDTLIKDVDGKKGIITGYFSVFNNEDSDGDTIIPGAFAKTIQERGPQSAQPRIKHLLNHSSYEPIGVLLTLKEDSQGLYYESMPGTHALGIDVVKMIESGLISEHSIGFETVRKTVVDPNADYRDRKQVLQEIKLWEGSSLTAWGANDMTGGAVLKGIEKDDLIKTLTKRQKGLEKFCRNSDATDETIEMLLLESKQLTQIILDISTKATAPEKTEALQQKSTLPEGIKETLTTFRKTLITN